MNELVRNVLMGAAGSADESTFVDDVFSTYVYAGNSTARSINNGLDLSGEGGMVWIKSRDNAYDHYIVDTERGALNRIRSNSDGGSGVAAQTLTAFNNNGFALGADSINLVVNASNKTYASWSFRKAPGFFTIKEYTGSGSTQSLTHDLGSIPGCIMIKRTDATAADWAVYHRGQNGGVNPEDYRLKLNSDTDQSDQTYWGDTAPTASHFTVGDSHTEVNASGGTYIAYLFAGGESTADTARSVDFDGSGDTLQIAQHADLGFGTGDYTVEFWIKFRNLTTQVAQVDFTGATTDDMWQIYNTTDGKIHLYRKVGGSGSTILSSESLSGSANGGGQWFHIAVTRASNTTRLYVNGTSVATTTDTTNYPAATFTIANRKGLDLTDCNCQISNVRIVKGTAVYTSSFRPPTAGLTDITNTKLLCCNKNTVTGSTVTPGTITANGNPQSSTSTPFDDPNGFKFGEGGDQNLIKCGSYIGASGANEVDLGWEPQWVLLKNIDSVEPWILVDNMRGWVDESSGARSLRPDSDNAESGYSGWGTIATGWALDLNQREIDQNEQNYVYIAIRRPDPLIAKPVEVGTETFTMDTGNGSSVIPAFDSGFPVDFAITRQPASTEDWLATSRKTGTQYVRPNTSGSQNSWHNFTFDSNVGWSKSNNPSTSQSWMWKRGAGFDLVTFKGTAANPGPEYAHSLGQVPELKFLKRRDAGGTGWIGTGTVISQAMVGNTTSAKDYYIYLDTSAGAVNSSNYWSGNDTATHFTVRHGNGEGGGSADPYLCLLFASVAGISKVGYYTGNGYSGHTITTGFSPRFVLIRRLNGSEDNWVVLDTLRGWAAGNDNYISLNSSSPQSSGDMGAPTSTGFTLTSDGWVNYNTGKYIYYAHA